VVGVRGAVVVIVVVVVVVVVVVESANPSTQVNKIVGETVNAPLSVSYSIPVDHQS